MGYLIHAEHYAKNRSSQGGLDQDLLFFGPPHTCIITMETKEEKGTGNCGEKRKRTRKRRDNTLKQTSVANGDREHRDIYPVE